MERSLDTVGARIIKNDARTSRISPFGLRGEITAKRFSFSSVETNKKKRNSQTLLGETTLTSQRCSHLFPLSRRCRRVVQVAARGRGEVLGQVGVVEA